MFLTVPEAVSPRSRHQHGHVLARTPFLAHSWRLLTASSHRGWGEGSPSLGIVILTHELGGGGHIQTIAQPKCHLLCEVFSTSGGSRPFPYMLLGHGACCSHSTFVISSLKSYSLSIILNGLGRTRDGDRILLIPVDPIPLHCAGHSAAT